MEVRVLRQLVLQPMGKAQLSEAMGQKVISGQLNKVIRVLVTDQTIEPTIPEKPTSRLQKYRLTEKGRRLLEELGKGGGQS
ncbi:Fic family protein [Chlorobium ferrooxidans]|uniref:ATP-dependent DNA helicase n=1 Tax=Chlorobium ferrooxidans DSM 13031 TaxID=377431 RepID=Q0YTA4_9CHLB|nr:ATP-dependent DNA helicase [Chlorobium ferrooxidans DSM 13031]